MSNPVLRKEKISGKYPGYLIRLSWKTKDLAKNAGFKWSQQDQAWWTSDPQVAARLIDYADSDTRNELMGRTSARVALKTVVLDVADVNADYPLYFALTPFDKNDLPSRAGMEFNRRQHRWETREPYIAAKLGKFATDVARALLVREIGKLKARLALSRAVDIDFDVPFPKDVKPYGFQKAGIKYAVESERAVTLIADEMGLGKTLQAIGVLNTLDDPRETLIVCPAFLKENWRRELERFRINRNLEICVVDPDGWPRPRGGFLTVGHIWVINYDLLERYERELHVREFDLAVFDECHYVKNPEANRSAMIQGGTVHKYRSEAYVDENGKTKKRKVLVDKREVSPLKTKFKLPLSGTPLDKPVDLLPILQFMEPGRWSKAWFLKRYCTDEDPSSSKAKGEGSANLAELQTILRGSVVIRRQTAEVLKDLPEMRRQIIILPDVAKIAEREAMFLKGKDELLESLKAQVVAADEETNPEAYRAAVQSLTKAKFAVDFGEVSRVIRESGLAKVPQIVEAIRDDFDQGIPGLLMFGWNTDVIKSIAKEFDPATTRIIVGETPVPDRMQIVDECNAGKVKLLVGSIGAMGTGLNLQCFSYASFAQFDWTPGMMLQAEKRIHRIGTKESVLIRYYVVRGTIDEKMIHDYTTKWEVADQALDRVAAT